MISLLQYYFFFLFSFLIACIFRFIPFFIVSPAKTYIFYYDNAGPPYRSIRDHLWRWSTYFSWNIPTEIRRSIFDKPVLCPNKTSYSRFRGCVSLFTCDRTQAKTRPKEIRPKCIEKTVQRFSTRWKRFPTRCNYFRMRWQRSTTRSKFRWTTRSFSMSRNKK